MYLKKLFLHEKLFLIWRAHRDIKKGYLKPVKIPGVHQRGDQRYGAQDSQPLSAGVSPEQVIYISPFLKTELEEYRAIREYHIGVKRRLIMTLRGPGVRKLMVSNFTQTLDNLDAIVNDCSTELDLIAVRYSEELDEWERKKEECAHRNLPHMVQLYVNKAADTRKAYYGDSLKFYRSIISMLSKKLAVINSMSAKLTAIRRKTYLRIQYYYQAAASYDKGFFSGHISDDHFGFISDMGVMESYEETRQTTIARLEEFKNEIGQIKNGA